MARKNQTTQLLVYGAGGYLLYSVAIKGNLGDGAYKVAASARDTVKGLLSGVTGGTGAGIQGSVIGAITAANPNFDAQLIQWQTERSANGENPYDWAAFRAHEIAIGAPDPGPTAPTQFYGSTAGGSISHPVAI